MRDLHGEIDSGDIHTDGGDRYRPGRHREFAAALCDVRERAAGGRRRCLRNPGVEDQINRLGGAVTGVKR